MMRVPLLNLAGDPVEDAFLVGIAPFSVRDLRKRVSKTRRVPERMVALFVAGAVAGEAQVEVQREAIAEGFEDHEQKEQELGDEVLLEEGCVYRVVEKTWRAFFDDADLDLSNPRFFRQEPEDLRWPDYGSFPVCFWCALLQPKMGEVAGCAEVLVYCALWERMIDQAEELVQRASAADGGGPDGQGDHGSLLGSGGIDRGCLLYELFGLLSGSRDADGPLNYNPAPLIRLLITITVSTEQPGQVGNRAAEVNAAAESLYKRCKALAVAFARWYPWSASWGLRQDFRELHAEMNGDKNTEAAELALEGAGVSCCEATDTEDDVRADYWRTRNLFSHIDCTYDVPGWEENMPDVEFHHDGRYPVSRWATSEHRLQYPRMYPAQIKSATVRGRGSLFFCGRTQPHGDGFAESSGVNIAQTAVHRAARLSATAGMGDDERREIVELMVEARHPVTGVFLIPNAVLNYVHLAQATEGGDDFEQGYALQVDHARRTSTGQHGSRGAPDSDSDADGESTFPLFRLGPRDYARLCHGTGCWSHLLFYPTEEQQFLRLLTGARRDDLDLCALCAVRPATSGHDVERQQGGVMLERHFRRGPNPNGNNRFDLFDSDSASDDSSDDGRSEYVALGLLEHCVAHYVRSKKPRLQRVAQQDEFVEIDNTRRRPPWDRAIRVLIAELLPALARAVAAARGARDDLFLLQHDGSGSRSSAKTPITSTTSTPEKGEQLWARITCERLLDVLSVETPPLPPEDSDSSDYSDESGDRHFGFRKMLNRRTTRIENFLVPPEWGDTYVAPIRAVLAETTVSEVGGGSSRCKEGREAGASPASAPLGGAETSTKAA